MPIDLYCCFIYLQIYRIIRSNQAKLIQLLNMCSNLFQKGATIQSRSINWLKWKLATLVFELQVLAFYYSFLLSLFTWYYFHFVREMELIFEPCLRWSILVLKTVYRYLIKTKRQFMSLKCYYLISWNIGGYLVNEECPYKKRDIGCSLACCD